MYHFPANKLNSLPCLVKQKNTLKDSLDMFAKNNLIHNKIFQQSKDK